MLATWQRGPPSPAPLRPQEIRERRPAVSPQPRLTSKRCELTFLPFLFQVTRGLGSPVA